MGFIQELIDEIKYAFWTGLFVFLLIYSVIFLLWLLGFAPWCGGFCEALLYY